MINAGFYLSPTNEHEDNAICYACGLNIFDWDSKKDPW